MKKDEIVEQLATGKMSRRQFNKNLMALGATMVMMPMVSQNPQAGSGDHPTVFTWEGWEVPELHSAYISKYGGSPNISIFADEEVVYEVGKEYESERYSTSVLFHYKSDVIRLVLSRDYYLGDRDFFLLSAIDTRDLYKIICFGVFAK